MFGTGVPETAVDEDGEARSGEQDVGFAPKVFDRSTVLIESKAMGVQGPPERDLGTRVAGTIRAH